MKINYLILKSENNSEIKNFLLSLDNFDFIYSNNFNDVNLLIITPSIGKNELMPIISKMKKNENRLIIFAHESQKNILDLIENKIIYYPINCYEFEKKINLFFFDKDLFFLNISINHENFLINNNNQKKQHITETEFKIMKLFFTQKIVERKKLHVEILNLHPEIDTKSLDSHLSRIRAKLSLIDSGLSIVARDSQKFELTKLAH